MACGTANCRSRPWSPLLEPEARLIGLSSDGQLTRIARRLRRRRGCWRGGAWSGRWRIRGRRARCRCWFRSGGRLGRRRSLGLDPTFPGRTGIHVGCETLGFPFLFEIRCCLVGRLARTYHGIPRIDLGTDLAGTIGSLEIQGDGIASIGPEVNVHTANVFKQMRHATLQGGA